METSTLDKHSYTLAEAKRYLYEQDYDDATVERLLKFYCLSSESAVIQRTGLEYLYMNEYFIELQELITINMNRLEAENRQWSRVYQILLNQHNETEKPEILLARLKEIQTESLALLAIIEFGKASLYGIIDKFWQEGNFLAKQEQFIPIIADPMMRTFLKTRLNERLFMYHWRKNEVIIARKYAYKTLQTSSKPLMKIRIQRNLGLSYLFETYKQGMFHFNKAIQIARNYQLTSELEDLCNNQLPFFALHFNKTDGLQPKSKYGKVCMHIANGENEQALYLLKEMSASDPFVLYFIGLATGEEHYLTQSYECFMSNNNHFFFARLPIQAMRH